MSRVLHVLPKVHGDFIRLSLDIIQTQAASYNGLFIELRNRGFLDILTNRWRTNVVALIDIVNLLSFILKYSGMFCLCFVVAVMMRRSSIQRSK
jgi:hypothetical protein